MSDRHQHWPGSDDGEDLASLLDTYASNHDPDLDRILTRFDQRRSRATSRHRAATAARAAGAGMVAVAAAAVAVVFLNRPDPGTIQTAGPDSSPVQTATAAPSSSTTSSMAAQTDEPPRADTSLPSTSGSTAATLAESSPQTTESTLGGALSDDDARISVEVIPADLVVSTTSHLDWLIPGAGQAGGEVTLAGRTPLIDLTVTGTAEPTAAPLEVAWTGGSPTEAGTNGRSWQAVPAAPTAYELQFPAATARDEIAVWAGGSGRVQVTITIDGASGERVAHLPDLAADIGTGGLVKVLLSGEARTRGVTIVIGGEAGSGAVALGAVTVR